MRGGDIGDEAAGSADDAEQPLDLEAVRADDDLIEALSAGLVPPPCGPRDPDDVEGELVALLAGWVADIRPETLLHRPSDRPAVVGLRAPTSERQTETSTPAAAIPIPRIPTARPTGTISAALGAASPVAWNAADTSDAAYDSTAHTEPPTERIPVTPWPHTHVAEPADTAFTDPSTQRSPAGDGHAQPIPLERTRGRSLRPYLVRAAAAATAVALVVSGILVGSYDAHPGEPLWVVVQMVFPAKSRSVAAASAVSTALNTARVALERGRVGEARAAFQFVQAQLAAVEDADGRSELTDQTNYLDGQLSTTAAVPAGVSPVSAPSDATPPLALGSAGAVIPSNPAVTPGATKALAATATRAPASVAAPPAVTSPGLPLGTGTSTVVAAAPPAAPAPTGPSPVGPSPVGPSDATPPAGTASVPPAVSDPMSTSGGAPRQTAVSSPPDPSTDTPKLPPPPLASSEVTAPSPVVDSTNNDTAATSAGHDGTTPADSGPSISTSGADAGEGGAPSAESLHASDPTTTDDVAVHGDVGGDLGDGASSVSSTDSPS